MTTRRAKIYFLLFALTSCSNKDQKEKAEKYFDLVQTSIEPWVTSGNNMVKETMPIMRRFYNNGRKLNTKDSLEILTAFNGFNKISEETIKRFNNLETFEEYDLKKPTLECIERNTKLIQETFNEVLYHSYSKKRTPEQMDKMKDDFQKEFIEITEYYFQTQNEFKRKFGIE